MSDSLNEKTFFGFWPADDYYCSLDSIILDGNGFPDKTTRHALKDTLLDFKTDDWHIIISKDYMCLLHLKSCEDPLNVEREHNATCELCAVSLKTTRQIKNQYIESLNALYFLIFSSCFTGRGAYFLHDFSEITTWQCFRVMYSSENIPLRRIQFGRATKKDMIRRGQCIEEQTKDFLKIEPTIFKDAIHYWDIIYKQNLVSLASVGTKIISEHRLESYDLSIVLAWFEIEKWIMQYVTLLGIPTQKISQRGRISYFGIKEIIKNFPTGTTINSIASELDTICRIRDNIAHNGSMPSLEESSETIKLFVKMFNIRSGLNLSVSTDPTPSNGM